MEKMFIPRNNMLVQCDFFETFEQSKLRMLEENNEKIALSLDKVRKGTYAKLGDHEKRLGILEQIVPILEQVLCKGSMQSQS